MQSVFPGMESGEKEQSAAKLGVSMSGGKWGGGVGR